MCSLKNLHSTSAGHRRIANRFKKGEEVSRWAPRFETMGVASGTNIPTHPNSLYIWVSLPLSTLEYDGYVDYMETHPKYHM